MYIFDYFQYFIYACLIYIPPQSTEVYNFLFT